MGVSGCLSCRVCRCRRFAFHCRSVLKNHSAMEGKRRQRQTQHFSCNLSHERFKSTIFLDVVCFLLSISYRKMLVTPSKILTVLLRDTLYMECNFKIIFSEKCKCQLRTLCRIRRNLLCKKLSVIKIVIVRQLICVI